MSPTPRLRKVNSTLREVLADEIERLTDPRVEMVSVTAVDTSPDLRNATVYISTVDLERGPDAVEALNKATKRLQSALARQVRLKYTPHLQFAVDTGVVHGDRIDAILRDIAVQPEDEDQE
ncbi:MAG TPA: 30S ribosome-binding factor RbfA [Acidimicrobiia bacterium]|nr:30S ribosome-binding factor RbfA [Acidimicrobiia bacterium]